MIIDAKLKALCLGLFVIGNLQKPAEINIIFTSYGQLNGTTNNIDPKKTKVVIWAKTDRWYVQPWIDNPFAPICGNSGQWGNSTHSWNTMAALLIDSTYVPGSIRYQHPSSNPGVIAWTQYSK